MSAKTIDYGWDDATPCSDSYIAPAVARILTELGAKTVLDAGCGNGALAIALDRQGFAVTGVDGDDGGVAIAKAARPDMDFRQMTFDQDPGRFPAVMDGGFDAVVSTEVVEHLYAPHELVAFARRALRPGGHVILSTPYHGFLKNLALSLFNKWDRHLTPLWHGGHIKFWSRETLGQLLRQEGFEVVGFDGVGRYPYLWKSMVITARKPA